jgi:hypothetical protein
MDILDEAIEIWNKEKERLEQIKAPMSVPYGDWTYHKNEILLIALKLYKLKQLEKNETSFLFSKRERRW